MIPLRDNIRASRTPVVTICLIGACTLAFLFQLQDPEGELIERLGMVPARVLDPDGAHLIQVAEPTRFGMTTQLRPVAPAAVPEWLTLLTCTFLHGGWLHFLGNMLFLWIFGDNVEDRFGRPGFVAFYLGTGVAASATHLLLQSGSTVPTIGASGAIAGVMGGYFVLYPHAKVQMLIVFGFFVDVVLLPAPLFLGYWFVLQFFQTALSLSAEVQGGGVAFGAHAGGFVAGFALALTMRALEKLRPAQPEIVLERRRRYRPHWPRRPDPWS